MKSPVKRSSKEAVDGRLRKLRGLILKAQGDRALDALLSDLLTPHELVSIAERIAILEALGRGDTLRTVASKVHVSMSKVVRGSAVVQYGKSDWKKIATSRP